MSATLKLEPLLKMLDSGRDSPLLRMSIALALQQQGDLNLARQHLQAALDADPQYAAAWRLLGLLAMEQQDHPAAEQAFSTGLEAAARRGDKQLEKELTVRLKRVRKAIADAATPS